MSETRISYLEWSRTTLTPHRATDATALAAAGVDACTVGCWRLGAASDRFTRGNRGRRAGGTVGNARPTRGSLRKRIRGARVLLRNRDHGAGI